VRGGREGGAGTLARWRNRPRSRPVSAAQSARNALIRAWDEALRILMTEVADRGTTVLMSSHLLSDLRDVCDHC
jgi:ABC-type thiamine transport system ATPase subunit